MKHLNDLILYAVLLFIVSECASAYPLRPNPLFSNPVFCTYLDKDFDGYRYKDNIPHCKRNVRSSIKRRIYSNYGIAKQEQSQYTIDHLIPLFLGGSNDIRNLWPQSKMIYTGNIEGRLYYKVKDGKISVNEALNIILNIKYQDTLDNRR